MKSILIILAIASAAAFAAACNPGGTNTAPAANPGKTAGASNTAPAANAADASSHAAADETPAAVKAAFPEAQTFTTQHKDVPDSAVATIEKDTGGKIPDKDHHSYLAFATKDGKRTQVGAATVVKADGKDVVIVYENKGGMPTIREVRAEGVPAPFLAQFAGKGHDDKFEVGGDLKLNGADEASAKAIALAVRVDAATMQSLYGAAHTH